MSVGKNLNQQCEIRECAQSRGCSGCHQGAEFPCQIIEAFSLAVGKKVILRSVPHRRQYGSAKWVRDETARYVCPACGNSVFRGCGSVQSV